MADNFGVSFVPGQGGPGNPAGGPQGAGGANPVQTAIQMLSLHFPRVVGANGLAPGPLLQGGGAMGQPGANLNGTAMNPLLMALLRLAGLNGGGTPGGGMPNLGAPGVSGPMTPHFTPASGDGLGGGPVDTMRGPGTTTFPPTGGGPYVDRSNPMPGNRGGGPTLSDWHPQLPSDNPVLPAQPPGPESALATYGAQTDARNAWFNSGRSGF